MPEEVVQNNKGHSYLAKVSPSLPVVLCFLFQFPLSFLCSTSLHDRGIFLHPKSPQPNLPFPLPCPEFHQNPLPDRLMCLLGS